MKILVTGAAGFIGLHVCRLLLNRGNEVLGIDNLNSYYSPRLKEARLAQLSTAPNFSFIKADLANAADLAKVFAEFKPQRVINLAAQAGVRYSLKNPSSYIQSNLVGFANLLECCRQFPIEHLVYASSSSVYGLNSRMPFSVNHNVDHPTSLYAATKKSNELMAHTYSHLYDIPTTGLRYFTVYGPWGRPDMSPWIFTEAILSGRPISIFNNGKMRRDFTYIDDIAEGTVRVLDKIPVRQDNCPPIDSPASSSAPYKIYNIGNNQPVELMTFIETLEAALGRKAKKEFLPMQPGDVVATYADIDALREDTGFSPTTPLPAGIANFVEWYRAYHNI